MQSRRDINNKASTHAHTRTNAHTQTFDQTDVHIATQLNDDSRSLSTTQSRSDSSDVYRSNSKYFCTEKLFHINSDNNSQVQFNYYNYDITEAISHDSSHA